VTRKSKREIERAVDDLDGGDSPADTAIRYKEFRTEARLRWNNDDYDGIGEPVQRLWDAYGIAYDDPRAWLGVRNEIQRILVSDDPRPSHSRDAPEGFDGELPVPTDRVAGAIESFEAAYEVHIRRLRNRDRFDDLPEDVPPETFGPPSEMLEVAELTALAEELF